MDSLALQQLNDEFEEADIFEEVEAIKAEQRSIESEMEKYVRDGIDEKTNSFYKSQLDVKPSVFAESVYTLDGRPFRLDLRDYLRMIYDADIKDGLLKCARQVEKSTTASTHVGNWTLLTPFVRSLYFAPLNDQVKVFSEDRLERLFYYSQENIVKKYYIDSLHTKQNVFNKSYLNGAIIYLRHCYGNADNIRGISANCLFGDEIQDVDVDALPVIGEVQSHWRDLGPGVKTTWFFGTPKTFSNTIQYLWEQSNQCEWVVRCLHCGADQITGPENVAPTMFVCRKCGRELTQLNIAKNARWIKMNERSEKWGFHINQVMAPSMSADEVWQKMHTYPTAKVYNEVFGLSYENADKPFNENLLNAMCDNEYVFYDAYDAEMSGEVFAGIDWGRASGSYTVLNIGFKNKYGELQLAYVKIYDTGEEVEPTYQLNHIIKMLSIYRVKYTIADSGDGFAQGKALKARFGARFDMCFYSDNQGKIRNYNVNSKMWIVNRTASLFEYIDAAQNYKIAWPKEVKDERYGKYEFLFKHHLAVQAEYRSSGQRKDGLEMITKTEKLMYTHPIGSQDDAFHAGHYMYMASVVKPPVVASGITFAGGISR